MAEQPVIYREEVVRVLFTMYDMSETLTRIYALLRDEEEDDGQEGEV